MINKLGLLSVKEARIRGSPRALSKNPPMIEQCGGKEKEIEEEKGKMPEGEMAAAYIRPL